MKIFTPAIHSQISKLQKELYDDNTIDTDIYLEQCFGIFNKTLKKHFSSKYIFAKLYFRPNINESPKIVDFFDQKRNETSRIFSEGIEKLEIMVEKGIAKSLSVVIIERFLRGILLYKGDEPERVPSIIESDFSEKSTEWFIKRMIQNKGVNGSKFKKNEIEGIKKLYEGHKGMADASKLKNVYSYLIRTRTFGTTFNGVLYLVSERDLRINEYGEIADLLTYILEVFGRYNNRPKVQQEEWEKLIHLQAHSNQHEWSILKKTIDDAYAYRKNGSRLIKNLSNAQNQINELVIRNKVLLYLVWYSSHPKSSLDEESLKEVEQKVEQKSLSSVKEILTECLQIIKDTLDVFINDENKIRTIREKCIPLIEKDISKIKFDYKVNVIKSCLKILFLERLKNTIYFANNENPEVRIHVLSSCSEIHFTNNQSTSESAINNFNNRKYDVLNTKSKRFMGGEKLQDAILDFPFFSDSYWVKIADGSSCDESLNKTNIYFKFGKNNE